MEETLPAIVPEQETPASLIRWAGDAAEATRKIVEQSAVTIQAKRYIRAEGWMAIALAHGCVASARNIERVETGFRCLGEVRRIRDGLVLATAEGFVGDDEPTWAKRPEFARRSMCQTRAISKVCRSCFAHVVVLMNAGLSVTPAEEMEDPSDKRITPSQQRLLFARCHELGISAAEAKEVLRSLGYSSSSEIPAGKLDDVLAALNTASLAAEIHDGPLNDVEVV